MPILSDFTPEHVQDIAREMDMHGYARLENALSAAELAQLRDFTDSRAARHPGEYFAYHGEAALAESLLASLWADTTVKQLLADLYRHAAGRTSSSNQIFPVLRCVQGDIGRRESNCFHYDASLVTALIPIHIPVDGEECGDLMLFPNLRKVRDNVVFNVIEKSLMQNRVSRWLTCQAIERGWARPRVLKLNPGDIYLFWGYRTLHANKPCSPNLKRATAILHYGDPHSGSTATRVILGLNQRRAARRSARTNIAASETTPRQP